jgi:hypothetical protein
MKKPTYVLKLASPTQNLHYATTEPLDFPLVAGKIKSNKFPVLDGEIIFKLHENIHFRCLYVGTDIKIEEQDLDSVIKGDKEALGGFLENVLSQLGGDNIDGLIEKGWTKEPDPSYQKHVNRMKKLQDQMREYDSFVIPTEEHKKNVMGLQGGLSDKLFFNPKIQSYLVSEDFYGYLGHENRTFPMDYMVERVLKQHKWTDTMIAIFMCSARGRTIAESNPTEEDLNKLFEDYDPNEDEEFLKRVKQESCFNN